MIHQGSVLPEAVEVKDLALARNTQLFLVVVPLRALLHLPPVWSAGPFAGSLFWHDT